jgi:hypothetical protein
MAEKLLDGLARALAEPMPRRGAVRVIATALVAIVVPGLSPGAGRGAVEPEGRRRNAGSRRTDICPDGSECTTGLCCPMPSPNSGQFNCCKTTAHCCCGNACCDPQSQICICPIPGGVGGGCVDKTCGPNLTEPLGYAVVWMKTEFARWSAVDRRMACDSLYDLGPIAWDIAELDPPSRRQFIARYGPECTTCGDAVQVGHDCHHAGSVNYVVFGAMMRLCHDHYKGTVLGPSARWFSEEAMNLMIVLHKTDLWSGAEAGNLDPSIAWAKAGYRGWPPTDGTLRGTPHGDRDYCKATCGKPYKGPGLTVRWGHKRIRLPR